MIIDNDTIITREFEGKTRFAGRRTLLFNSNIYCTEVDGKFLNMARAYVKDGDKAYRAYVVFDHTDVIYHGTGRYAYSILRRYRKGEALDTGRKLRGNTFELNIVSTEIKRTEVYDRNTGYFAITSEYYLIAETRADENIKVSDTNFEGLETIDRDITYRKIEHVVDKPLSFEGTHRVTFLTNIFTKSAYNDNDPIYGYVAKVNINGVNVLVDMNNLPKKITPASRWCPYTIVRPEINGRGTTIKNHNYMIDVVETVIDRCYTYDEASNKSVMTYRYAVKINPDTFRKAGK